ncbi:ATPase WRNIP1 [Tribolium castaneum]|uniref:ATPase WRNIP1-like Protein n=1 Tax=Tribolium castaneum TaxID=7070 RepID=D6WKM9_TRICA|nr:PREDICTED: ATPase WRNIP1 [Tribolium castaneum]EFA03020.2 ATPase WRNIP1-like Protein [Tribolium castaneum]|eukprot:XP_971125.1 PREDICTED: ATPase WRNIP1 [Tribolium castaneum]
MDKDNEPVGNCPICDKPFSLSLIESHVNKCIFLNSADAEDMPKRKRSPSPILPQNTTKPKTTQKMDLVSPSKKPKTSSSTSTTKENPLTFTTPLAKQLQPKCLDDFMGQSHVLGENTVLRTLLEKGDIPNMVLWGPPGCGKTSLSGVIQGICKSNPTKLKFVSLCAATAGVKDVQNIVSAAKLQQKFGCRTVLFMDEIHRFNKKQQDIFLLHVEKGDIILVGATTENPSFTVNSALLSRCRVIVLQKLDPDCLYQILERGARNFNVEVVDKGARSKGFAVQADALKWLADISDGDARIALGNLQLVLQYNEDKNKVVTIEDIKEKIKKSHLLYDRKGEEHYNVISAMHKSIRGSDPNAALYWTTRMIVSGEDPLYIARRMVRAASEDIGNADPRALQLAVSTMQGCQLLGMPECDVLLAQCAIYLARAPKSREADSALARAKQLIKSCEGLQPSVPMHLRNAPTRLMKDLGYGKLEGDERYYMPPELKNVDFFK